MSAEDDLLDWREEFDDQERLSEAITNFRSFNGLIDYKTFEVSITDADSNVAYLAVEDEELHTLVISCNPRKSADDTLGYAIDNSSNKPRYLSMYRKTAIFGYAKDSEPDKVASYALEFLYRAYVPTRCNFSPNIHRPKDHKVQKLQRHPADVALKAALWAVRLLDGTGAARIHRWHKPEDR